MTKLEDENLTLKELQEYVWQMNIDRGFSNEDASQKLVMLMEEVGELAKSVRKQAGMKFTISTKQTDIEEELADVQIILLGMASLMKIDMRKAVAEKETKNRERTWE